MCRDAEESLLIDVYSWRLLSRIRGTTPTLIAFFACLASLSIPITGVVWRRRATPLPHACMHTHARMLAAAPGAVTFPSSISLRRERVSVVLQLAPRSLLIVDRYGVE